MTGFNSKREESQELLDTLDQLPYQGRESRPEELAPVPPKLWLWKNFVDGRPEYWAFDNPFPVHMDGGDPQTLGEPCGYALFKPSRAGRTDVSDAEVLRRVITAAPVPAVQSAARAIADEQSYDTGLWFVATTVTEAHLQAALRRLTAAVEGEAPVPLTPLTDEQIDAISLRDGGVTYRQLARAIEASHGIGEKP